MEFLVRIEVRLPADLPDVERADLAARELARGRALQDAGTIVRIWRIPGRYANVSVWKAVDATDLHDLLTSLPLFPWMDIQIEPLALHPLDGPRDGPTSP